MDLAAELARCVDSDRVSTRRIDRIAFANDASVYRLVPRAVAHVASVAEIRALLRFSHEHRVPLTFRAAGTSLSGQAVTDGVLAVVSRHFRGIVIEGEGRRVRVEPGIIGGLVNRHLAPYGVKIGPDPASINACMIGGILANNSSGMCCGVEQNAYHTLESMRFVLPDGTELDSAQATADTELRERRPELHGGLLELKRDIESDSSLRERIRRKYRMKNTTGYSLNAFLDFETPIEILTHLMIGSEGTLGFIAEAVLRTVPDYPHKSTGLLFFDDVPQACAAIEPLRHSGARALELMDRASLRAVAGQPGMPERIETLPPQATALLVEYQCATEEELEARGADCVTLLPRLALIDHLAFTRDGDAQAALWRVRKGLIPSVGAMRARGTSFIIEDVVFPVDRLARGVGELQELFREYRYDDAILFGHAKDGNLHFVLTQSFEDPREVTRYDGFMKALAGLVAGRHGGALKAEHGTGRNMAPFVVDEWGSGALEIMRRLKRLVDPEGLLNPGVILNDNPRAHVTDLKELPRVEKEVDRCIECGFCEWACPSRDLTLTPRQRIVVRREMTRLRESDSRSRALRELESDFDYAGLSTCATDGLCALSCPVSIDTGSLTKRLRRQTRSRPAILLARLAATRFGWVERGARLALRVAALGSRWSAVAAALPVAGPLPVGGSGAAAAIYFPSCVSRVVGPPPGERPLPDVVSAVARRAGVELSLPRCHGLCCGMPFSSRGYGEAHRLALERTVNALWDWSEGGRLPVVVDSSPCAWTLRHAGDELPAAGRERVAGLRILDGIEFAEEQIVPRLKARSRLARVALHPVCSVRKMGLEDRLGSLAAQFADEVFVPVAAGCCGMAGDRGLRLPELPRAAIAPEAAELDGVDCDGYFTSSRTCEIALRQVTGRPFRSFWYLVDETTG